MVTLSYDKDRGLRVLGQREGGRFDFSLQRTVKASPQEAYDAVTRPRLLSRWFTHGARVDLRVGGSYRTGDGDKGMFLLLEPPGGSGSRGTNPTTAPARWWK